MGRNIEGISRRGGVEGGAFSERYSWRAKPLGDQELQSNGIHLGGARMLQKSTYGEDRLVLYDSSIH